MPQSQQRSQFYNNFETPQQKATPPPIQQEQQKQSDMRILLDEMRELEEEFNIKELIEKVRAMKNQMRGAKDDGERMGVVKQNYRLLNGLY